MRRAVITGLGAISPLGSGVVRLWEGLRAGETAVRHCPGLAELRGLRTTVAAEVPELDSHSIDRKKRRYMSKMSLCVTIAAREALEMAALTSEQVQSPRTGVCFGSTTGSTQETENFFRTMLRTESIDGLKSTHFFKIMNNSCAANLAQALGIRGRLLAPAAACATSSVLSSKDARRLERLAAATDRKRVAPLTRKARCGSSRSTPLIFHATDFESCATLCTGSGFTQPSHPSHSG